MNQIERFLGLVTMLLYLATGGLAIFIVGVLLSQTLLAPATQAPAMAAVTLTEPATPVPAAAPTVAEPAPASPGVTLAAGEKVFKKCLACHTVDEGGAAKVGPNLWGVVGRDVATAADFGYSDAMHAAGGSWDVARLDAYLAKPKDVVPGTKMTFAGLNKEADRQAVIFYLAQNSATPLSAAELGFEAAGAAPVADAAAAAGVPALSVAEIAALIEDVPYPDGVTYVNPPPRTAARQAEIDAKVAALQAEIVGIDYERARYHPLHFPPAIETASNEECLVCHQEIMTEQPLAQSPAGVPATDTIAWYQTLDTYMGDQSSFHFRHLQSDYAQAVMNLQCVFCHKGNDPREESPDMMPVRAAFTAAATPEFTLRKMVNPETTCLLCHGAMPDPEAIMGLGGPWHEVRADMEYPEAPNGCLSCHAESFRTERHAVSYLNAANIEEIARWGSSDSCYGCHGGRAWYRISYPYPRHAWPLMDEEPPEWALGRPTASDPAYALPAAE